MSKVNDGGPAFPSGNEFEMNGVMTTGHKGLSRRDYFVGQALAGVCAGKGEHSASFLVELAISIGDATLEALDE